LKVAGEDQQLHVLLPDPKPARRIQQEVSDVLSAVYQPDQSPSKPVQQHKQLRRSEKKAALAQPYDIGQDHDDDEASRRTNSKYRSIESEEEEAEKKSKDTAEKKRKRKAEDTGKRNQKKNTTAD
jgi:hypothetical protein